jgi:hypothetical protein
MGNAHKRSDLDYRLALAAGNAAISDRCDRLPSGKHVSFHLS